MPIDSVDYNRRLRLAESRIANPNLPLDDTERVDAETYNRVMADAGNPTLSPIVAALIVARQRVHSEDMARLIEARQRARERGEIYWSTNKCEVHGYEGIPKCPWQDCPNGSGRDIYRTVKFEDRGGIFSDIAHWRTFIREEINLTPPQWLWREVVYLPDPTAPIESAKAKFMAVCSEWADVLIGDSSQLLATEAHRPAFDINTAVIRDFPKPIQEVILAGYQLLLDSYDAIAATKEPTGE